MNTYKWTMNSACEGFNLHARVTHATYMPERARAQNRNMHNCVSMCAHKHTQRHTHSVKGEKRGVRSTLPKACAEQIP